MGKRILIVEDEKDIQDLLQRYLKREGYEVQTAEDGEAGLRKIAKDRFDLIILDLMLPQIDGMEICRVLRSQPRTASVPIIMLTAKAEETDRIVGLEMGADDYITKPFSPREVVARVKAIFRRVETPREKEKVYEYNGILLDPFHHEVAYKGKILSLTTKEFKLLEYFLANQGRVLSRDLLLNQVWGLDYFGTTRTVDVHVAHLRQKFPLLNRSLLAIKGLGYKLQDKSTKS
jgi:two-component system alkaline phosphatase synthesis response regulator PhoP